MATLRRFDFKLELKPLGRAGLARAFGKFFGMEAPDEIMRLQNLTPGDFAVVKKQLRFTIEPSVQEIASALVKESKLKPEASMTIGFL